MKKTIKRAKITKGHTLEIELVESLDDKTERIVSMKCDQLYHADLRMAFEKLKAHLVVICDQRESMTISSLEDLDEKSLENIQVTQFIISGSDANEGIVLVGQKLIGDKVLNLISPFMGYDEDYRFSQELPIDIAACVYEVEQYLFEGKYAIKQLDLFEGDKEIDPDSGEMNQIAGEITEGVLSIVGKNLNKKSGKRNGKKKDIVTDAFIADENIHPWPEKTLETEEAS